MRTIKLRGQRRYQIDFKDANGLRKIKTFKFKADALEFEKDFTAAKDRVGQQAFLNERQIREYWEAKRISKGRDLVLVAVEALRNQPETEAIPLGELAKDYVEVKAPDLKPRSLATLKGSMEHFTAGRQYRLVNDFSVKEIQDWSFSNGWAPLSRRRKLVDVGSLFNYALKLGMITKNPVDGITKPKAKTDEAPGVLTVEQARKLLDATAKVSPHILPHVAISLFTGIRRSEVLQLEGKDLNGKVVNISGHKAKSRRRRVVPILAVLKAWLEKAEDVRPLSDSEFRRALDRARAAAWITKWPNNAMRHSYASYRLAATQDAAKVSLELGHRSADMLFNHYREVVSEEDAHAYFNLMPE